MKCPRPSCRQPMIALGDGGFACSAFTCGAVVYLTDPAVGAGPSASSKPSTAEERSEGMRLKHERGQATRRVLEALG